MLLLLLCLPSLLWAEATLITDSRIKTFVYSDTEVYRIIIHNGFQSSIEFGLDESLETISVGDSYAWNINTVGRRIFIKPLEEDIHTNLTVITDKRTYQFEVISRNPSQNMESELAYVVRFYYPQEDDLLAGDDAAMKQ